MLRYEVHPGQSDTLRLARSTAPVPGPGQVLVGIQAVSLNYRDLLVSRNTYFSPIPAGRVPCSDGAGRVIAVGAGVTGLAVGDRVASLFFPGWQGGAPTPAAVGEALGAELDGVLAECFLSHERGLIRIPDEITLAEAATLPCAGLTAWHALFEAGSLTPGQTVVLQGTGGVSIFALQLAKAAGARVIITSSSDAKLERARSLGADACINYRNQPEWDKEVLRLTGGHGADVVVEVGGPGTLERSLNCVAVGGRIAYVGVLTGLAGQASPVMLIPRLSTINGIFVGSRAMFERLLAALVAHKIRPVIDQEFAFDQAPAALARMESAAHFGKLVLRVG